MDVYAATFQALSDPTRLRIVALLSHAGKELCVCELVDSLEEPQYHVSRSLARLKKAGLVSERPEGKWVYYSLPNHDSEFRTLLMKTVAAIPEAALRKDQRELVKRLKLRTGGKCLTGPRKTHLLSRRGEQ
ncbi:MAG: hypothetical protein PCFJNLEI_01142 [Verrucomicrobiae bacterium]|nr:hypothetical protein [Verrucomicrobiae bacterium]